MAARAGVCRAETGVHMALARHAARAPPGASGPTATPVNTGTNRTVLGALARDGLMAALTGEGRTDEPGFFPAVQTRLVPTWPAGQVGCMANRSAHHVSGVTAAMASGGARRAYRPPYAPDCSPLAQCWSQFTAIFRTKAARARDGRDQAMTEARTRMTPQDARGWFAHC